MLLCGRSYILSTIIHIILQHVVIITDLLLTLSLSYKYSAATVCVDVQCCHVILLSCFYCCLLLRLLLPKWNLRHIFFYKTYCCADIEATVILLPMLRYDTIGGNYPTDIVYIVKTQNSIYAGVVKTSRVQ